MTLEQDCADLCRHLGGGIALTQFVRQREAMTFDLCLKGAIELIEQCLIRHLSPPEEPFSHARKIAPIFFPSISDALKIVAAKNTIAHTPSALAMYLPVPIS